MVFIKDVSFPEADWAAFQCRLDDGELQLMDGEADGQSPTWKIRLSRCELTLDQSNQNINIIRIRHPVRRVIDVRASVSANTKALFESIVFIQDQSNKMYDDYLDIFSKDTKIWTPTYVYMNSRTRILEMYHHDRESNPFKSIDLREYVLLDDGKPPAHRNNSFSLQQSTHHDTKPLPVIFRCKSFEEASVWLSIIKSLARSSSFHTNDDDDSAGGDKEVEMKTGPVAGNKLIVVDEGNNENNGNNKTGRDSSSSNRHHPGLLSHDLLSSSSASSRDNASAVLSSSSLPVPTPFAMKGNLWKKGTGNKLFGGHRWKRRYFEVDNIFFLFYKRKGDRQAAARVCLQGYVTRQDPDKKYVHHFHLVNTTTNSKRSFNLRADTAEEFEDWMRSLHSTINFANSQSSMHNEHGHVEGEYDNFDDENDNDNASVAGSVG